MWVCLLHLATRILCQRNDLNGFITKFFNRTFVEYENGFGSPSSLYWIGLKSLHQLTQNNTCSAQFILQDRDNIWWSEEYVNIAIGDSSVGYQIHISGFQGNATDGMTHNDGAIFVVSCLQNIGGFWGFDECNIQAGINFVSKLDHFVWAGLNSLSLEYTEFWLICYNNWSVEMSENTDFQICLWSYLNNHVWRFLSTKLYIKIWPTRHSKPVRELFNSYWTQRF